MKIRPVTPADYTAVATVGVRSHIHSDPMDAYLYPYRHSHPDAYFALYLSHIYHRDRAPCSPSSVAETEPGDRGWTGRPEVIGYCIWYRATEIDEVKTHWSRPERTWDHMLRYYHDSTLAWWVLALFSPAASVLRVMSYGRADEECFDPAFQDPKETWAINELAVDPGFQRMGVGTQLLEWGMHHARVEGVPIVLNSTQAGQRLYERNGFVPYGTWRWAKGGQGDERVSKMMIWHPPGVSST